MCSDLIYTKFYKRMYLLFECIKKVYSVHCTYCKEMFLEFTMGEFQIFIYDYVHVSSYILDYRISHVILYM